MAAFRIGHRHDVKEERFHVVVERLRVQEALGQQAEVLAVRLLLLAVHLPHAHLLFPAIGDKWRPCQGKRLVTMTCKPRCDSGLKRKGKSPCHKVHRIGKERIQQEKKKKTAAPIVTLVPINFIAGRMPPDALGCVAP